uniref:Putative RNA-directed DNA polymerase from transposon X-element n=1 Tax=Larimichthys crocea TaxID=215358 RepID=A0A0F8AHH6_LARCR
MCTNNRPTTCPLDPIPSKLLQDIAPTVVPPITSVINASLSSGVFPAAFKQARVTPLLKKTTLNPASVENYRPVSLLPFLSKTIERTVSKQITDFLTHHHLLDPKQSGFRSGHSTETALLSVSEALKTARVRGQSSVLILLDLSAAFDTVNHDILLTTLANMGITGSAHSWLESYLAGRSFNVSWQGRLSSTHTLSTGVPQGSVLGPLLFAIYTTSLSHVIRSHGFSYHCYADDTQLYLSFQPDDTTVSARISACLSDLSTWMKDHHLQLNLSKTELLVIPAHESICHDFNLKIGTVTITPNHAAKNLGVIRPYLTQYAAQLLIQATVSSRLDYCNSLLAGLPACAIKPLQMVQNAAARLVFNQPKRSHVTPLFSDLHWLPVAARIKHKALTLAYKTISGSAPAYLSALLKAHVPTRALRSAHTNRLVVPSPLAKRGYSKLFSVVVPKWWNDLPTATRTATSLSTFKKLVKTFLFQECFPA